MGFATSLQSGVCERQNDPPMGANYDRVIYDQGEELKVFATEDAAKAWLDENDEEGVAFG